MHSYNFFFVMSFQIQCHHNHYNLIKFKLEDTSLSLSQCKVLAEIVKSEYNMKLVLQDLMLTQ